VDLAGLHGLGAASGINTVMTRYLLPKARNLRTGETVKTQDLTGHRWSESQRTLAEQIAQQLADKMSDRTGDPWQGFLESYTPSQRRS
jgi:hypothetical protein